MEIKRGDVFYITQDFSDFGSEQQGGRPGIVVSNDLANKHSPVIEVVYLTSGQKRSFLPTHVPLFLTRKCRAQCEQVHSVDKSRIGKYIRTLNGDEIKSINKGLAISLGLE